MFGRLVNSLQYNLRCKEREWRTTNPLRREYALSHFQKIVLALGRKPVLWGIVFLAIFLFLSLATALIDPAYWTLIVIEKFQVQSPSTYLISLWTIQSTIAALIYPIVIAFVAVLVQITNNAKADLYIYFHESGAVPASFYALLLVLIMGIQYAGLPYVQEEVVFFWVALDATWFICNLLLTSRFLLHTFEFILPSKREKLVIQYAVNVAWPAELRSNLSKELFFSACDNGLLPGPNRYGAIKGSEASILPGQYGTKEGRPEVTLSLRNSRQLQNVHFRLLSMMISRWKKRVSCEEEFFELPVTPFETYTSDVILCAIKGKTKLKQWEKFIIRHSFTFSSPIQDNPFKLSISEILSGIQSSAKAAIRSGQLDRYEIEVERMVKFYLTLIQASKTTDQHGNLTNWTEIGDRDRYFAPPIFEQWSQFFLDLYIDATKRLDDDLRYFTTLAVIPNRLFVAATDHSSAVMSQHFLLLSHILLRRIEDWWNDTAERLGNTDQNLSNPFILPPPYSRTQEKVLIKFVGTWQDFLSNCFLVKRGQDYLWPDFFSPALFFFSHIKYTVVSLFDCLVRGDRYGAEWLTDVLVKWYHHVRLPDTSAYMFRHQRTLTIELCQKDWESIQVVLAERGETYLERITPLAVFSSCLRNLWLDVIYLTVFVLAEKSCECSNDDCLPAELLSALLQGKSLRPGDEPISQVNLANFNDLLHAIIRQHSSIDIASGKYEERLDSIIEGINDLDLPNMVSGRMYSGWGIGHDLRSVLTGRLLTLMLTAKQSWKPDAFINCLIKEWTTSKYDKVLSLKSTFESWEKRLNEPNFSELEVDYDRLQRKIGLGLSFTAAQDVLLNVIQEINSLLDKEYLEVVTSLPIDSQQLRTIEKWASKLAFSLESSEFPVNTFSKIQSVSKPLQPHKIRIQGIDRGALTKPRCSPFSFDGDEEWYASMVGESVTHRTMDQLVSLLQIEEISASSPESYWLQVKAFAEKVKKQKLSPILLIENPTIPEWVWDWQHPPADGVPSKSPTDLSITHDEKRSEDDSYLCNLNDIPVHSAPISSGSSILLVKESFKKVLFREFTNAIFVEAEIEDIKGNAEKINLLLRWEMQVEVNIHPAVRLMYS